MLNYDVIYNRCIRGEIMDTRKLKSLRSFLAFILACTAIVNIMLTMEFLGYSFNLGYTVYIEDTTAFTAFTLFAACLGGILNMPRKLTEEEKNIIKKKTRYMFLGDIFFIGYIVFVIIKTRNIYFILSGLIMEGIYINIKLITKALHRSSLTDRQKLWREAVYGTTYDIQESNILWRFKLWMTPHERIPFKDRYFNPFYVLFIFMFIVICAQSEGQNLFIFIFLIILVRNVFSIIEGILGLYTSLTGQCTGIEEFEDSHHNGNNGGITISFNRRRYYWRVYITDFENKREVVYKTYRGPMISEGDKVKIIHGIFSKEVIIVNGIKIR